MAREQENKQKTKKKVKKIVTRKQVKERVYQKKVKRALKIARLRPLKNFLFWMTGVFSSIAIVAGSIFVAVKVVPIGTYIGKENATQYVSEEIANKSFLDAILQIGSYGFSDVPFVEKALRDLITDGELGQYVEIDYEKLNNIKFSDKDVVPTITGCLKITATLDGLGVSLGDFSNVSVFSDFEKIPAGADDYPQIITDENGVKKLDVESCNAKLYYVADDLVDSGANPMSEEKPIEPDEEQDANLYKRAFNDDGYFVSQELASAVDIEYYYPAITKVPITDAIELIGESFGRIEVIDLLDVVGGGADEDGEEGIVEKLFEGKNVQDLASFSASDIKLSVVLDLPTEENEYSNKNIYDIILQTTTDESVTSYEDITVDSLNGLGDFDNVKLSTVIEDTDSEIFKILSDALCDENGVPKDKEQITVGDITGFNSGNIKLSTVLELPTAENEYANKKIYDILCDATEKTADAIMVSDLSHFNMENVKLSTVLELPTAENEYENKKIYDILCDATGKTADAITITDLSSFTPGNIKLSTVLGGTDSKMFDILSGALADEYGNPKDKDQIIVDDLADGNFNVDNILLKDVLQLDEGDKLCKILCGGFAGGKNYDEIKVGMLSGGEFNVDNVSLSDILDGTDNAILSVLLEKGVTVGSLSTEIINLSLYDVYGKNCFKLADTHGAEFIGEDTWFAKEEIDTDGDGINDGLAFVHEDESYFTETGADKYGLCKNNGIWLLLCFDGMEFEDNDTDSNGVKEDTDGRPEKYVISNRTLGDLENNPSALSDSFEKATVRQLMDAGVIPEGSYNGKLYTMTLLQTVEKLSQLFDEIYR